MATHRYTASSPQGNSELVPQVRASMSDSIVGSLLKQSRAPNSAAPKAQSPLSARGLISTPRAHMSQSGAALSSINSQRQSENAIATPRTSGAATGLLGLNLDTELLKQFMSGPAWETPRNSKLDEVLLRASPAHLPFRGMMTCRGF